MKPGRNDPCPCGSGKKYKKCCYGKAFNFMQDDEGNVYKSLPITEEMREVFDEQHRKFVESAGREPEPDDDVFFDMPHSEHIEHGIVEAMKKANINPAMIFAFEKTGRLVTEENEHLLSEREIGEWNAAIAEYEAKHGKHNSPG
jgi:hypothetical protein